MTSLSIWQDKIILRTSEPLPLTLIKFAKFNEKFGAYLLSFGKQNLQRIFHAYGRIPVTRGQERIDELKIRYSEFKQMESLVQSSKCAEDFSSLEFKVNPLGKYQARGTRFLTEVKRAPLFADCGCLAGDTVIRYSRAGISRKKTLSELYRSFINTSPKKKCWDPDIKTYIRAFNGTYIGLHPLREVKYSGIKDVYKISLADGKTIKATEDHEVLTSEGWLAVRDLKAGITSVMVDNLTRHQKKRVDLKKPSVKYPDERVATGPYHPYARKQCKKGSKTCSYIIERHRLLYEAFSSGISCEDLVSRTYSGKNLDGVVFVNPKTHSIHHKNGNHYDNRPENLECLPRKEHAQIHTRGYLGFFHGVPEYSIVESVESHGKEDTYDIICEDPHRNFVANGMVVHNCGKTYMVLVSTENQIRKGVLAPGKTLICGKLMTLETGWKQDAKKFTSLKVNVIWAKASSKRKQKLLEILNDPADVYIINHDGVLVLENELREKQFQKVVVDESTILKSYHGDFARKGGKFGKALMSISTHADWRVVMSGTPAPNGPEDLWGQFKFLDSDGFLLEPAYQDFKNVYMKEIVFGKGHGAPSKWVCETGSWKEIKNLIDPYTYQVSIRDNIDLPPLFVMKRSVVMGDMQTNHYMEMYAGLSTVINDETIDVDIRLSQLTKLRQITGGFLIDHEENAHPIEDATKMEALDELIDEIGDDKIIIYAQYKWEIESIEERYKDLGTVSVYGGNSSSKNLENLKKFLGQEDIKIIVLHPRSAAHGITLTNSHYMIFYSVSYSAEENYQCIARIERASQKETMFVYYLLSEMRAGACSAEYESLAEKVSEEGTIDEIIYGVVQDKERNQQKLISQKDINLSILKKL